MANTGGGVIVVGLDDNGTPSGWDPAQLLEIDPAIVVDKLAKYVAEQFDEIEISQIVKRRRPLAAIEVAGRTGSPLVFEKPGAYVGADGRPREAFARGTVYFRHGAKSEPALARDLARFADREETRIRREMLRNLRRVSAAPTGSQVLVVPPHSAPISAVERVRVVNDPTAPAVARADYDATHPHRQKEVVAAVNARVGRELVNAHDILCVRRVHGIDNDDQLSHKTRFGSRQYSDGFVDWLVTSYETDESFFRAARDEYVRRLHAGRTSASID